MVKDAEAHAADDKTRREEIDTRNRAEAEAYQKEQAATAAEATPNQESPAGAAQNGEVVDAEFQETK
jgi:molecular chaperone DnaK (HSP70)